ncbi:MAG: Rieske 2Fe-2S domain-containing protein [Deltaproteobacteria bacterium]|nr:MAG: Rieske 2Fe-2S domain-containing protein [Deltaproteobacteria bacterium]TMQ24073.1 MAG: Rieske 2Fe-2S domain-containing protein [Deltaproteobacteria bacterium]
MTERQGHPRRTFLVQIAGCTACMLGGCRINLANESDDDGPLDAGGIIHVLPDPVAGVLTLPFSDFPVLRQTGGWVRGIPPAWGKPVIAVNTGGGYATLEAACPHRGCGVNYTGGLLFCPCHYSEFSLDGAILRGPAETPLGRYVSTVDATALRITLA